MDAGAVWVLNLDAEDELAARGAYTPSAGSAARVAAARDRARAVLAPGDALLEEVEDPAGRPGRAWCPTPNALAALRAAGAVPPEAPSLDVLRRVNGRSFLAALGDDLPGARVLCTEADLARLGPWAWRLQREHWAAGRGARWLDGAAPTYEDLAWARASLRRGPVLARPRVEVRRGLVRHGWLEADGTLTLGVPCEQVCDRHGQWIETRPVPGVLDDATAVRVGAALHAAGYFGPFGLDAIEYRDAGGRDRLAPCTDLNARYTMGWRVGMAGAATAG